MIFRISKSKLALLSLIFAAIIFLISNPGRDNPFYVSKCDNPNYQKYIAFAESQSIIVMIPRGAASPEVDITKFTPTHTCCGCGCLYFVPQRFHIAHVMLFYPQS